MLCKTKFFLTCTFLCAIFSNSTASSFKADSLFNAGNYFQAAIEYEYLFFKTDGLKKSQLYRYKKALCFKYSGNFQKAVNEFQAIYFPDKTDSLFANVAYEHALCLYLINDHQNALWKIDDYAFMVKDSASLVRFLPLKALIYNEMGDWSKARAELINYSRYLDQTDQELFLSMVDDLYNKKNIPKIKKIKTAENLSMFLPGAGQVYAGRPGEGTLNFLIQLSCLAFGAHQLSNGFTTFQFWNAFPFTGYLGGIGMWNKIYQGGIKRAGIIAEETNQHRIADFNHNINYLIIGTLDQ